MNTSDVGKLLAATMTVMLFVTGSSGTNRPVTSGMCLEPEGAWLREAVADWTENSDVPNPTRRGDNDFCSVDEIDPGTYEIRARSSDDSAAGFCAWSVGDWRDPTQALAHGVLWEGDPATRVDVPAQRGIALSLVHACEFRKKARHEMP